MNAAISAKEITVGSELPALRMELTATRIVAGALATGDFEPIHNDRSAAERVGRKDVFMNILMTNGLMQRCVTDWGGPETRVRKVRLRLSGGSVAGNILIIQGRVISVEDESIEVELTGQSGGSVVARAWVTASVPR
jgi:acyl dehydratase